MLRIESSAFSALPSWMNPSSPLRTTTAKDDRRVDPQTQHQLDEAGAKKNVDEDIVELGEEPHEWAAFFALWQPVRPIFLEPGSGLCCIEAFFPVRGEPLYRLIHGHRVP